MDQSSAFKDTMSNLKKYTNKKACSINDLQAFELFLRSNWHKSNKPVGANVSGVRVGGYFTLSNAIYSSGYFTALPPTGKNIAQ